MMDERILDGNSGEEAVANTEVTAVNEAMSAEVSEAVEEVKEAVEEVNEAAEEVKEEVKEEVTAEAVSEEVAAEAAAETVVVEETPAEKSDDEMSMGELMEKYDKQIRMGQIIKGKIIQIDDKEAIIGLVGAGNDGKLSISEVSFDESAKLTDLMKIGDEIEAKVIRRPIENDSFYILSKKEVQRDSSKNELIDILGTDKTIMARVKEVVKGGLVAFYKGHRIFIPASHVDVNSVKSLEKYLDQDIELSIIEAEERRGSTRIVASRKKHLLKKKQEMEKEAWETLEVGNVETGRVERLTDFGAFINVNGIDGLLHISEISYGKIPKPSSVLKVGEEVKVKIIGLDKENEKLSLSLRALMDDPWKNVSEKYPNESIVLGKVVRFTDFGAFIELEPGVDGLAHISQLSHSRVEKPSDVLTIGETIKVMVLDSNEENKKVSLSVKAVE